VHHDPPTYIYYLSPIATLGASLIAVVLAYLFGSAQGRAQTRYDRATEALTQILDLALEAEHYLEDIRVVGVSNTTDEWAEGVTDRLGQLQDVYWSSRPWLSPEQRNCVSEVIAAFGPMDFILIYARHLQTATGAPVNPAPLDQTLRESDVRTPIGALDDEVTRLANSPTLVQGLWNVLVSYVRDAIGNARGRD